MKSTRFKVSLITSIVVVAVLVELLTTGVATPGK